jgi:hypothetical protein
MANRRMNFVVSPGLGNLLKSRIDINENKKSYILRKALINMSEQHIFNVIWKNVKRNQLEGAAGS